MSGVNYKQLQKFAKDIEQLNSTQKDKFLEQCCKELAARLLAKVIKRTPVGVYDNGKTGGTLRRGWTGSKKGNASQYVESLKVNHFGDTYVIEITNPVDYASYVEYGHRTANHQGWVDGKFMLTISETEIKQSSPKILQNKLNKYLKEVFS